MPKQILYVLLIYLLIVNLTPANATEVTGTIELDKEVVNAGINKDGILHILVAPDIETSFASNELLILNPKNNKIKSRDLSQLAFSIVFSKNKNIGYIVGEQNISIIKGEKNKPKKRISVEIESANSVVLDEKNMQLFVPDGFNGLLVFNSKNLKLIKKGVLDHFLAIFA
ncbi:MAG: hypothetical protein A3I68_07465 [Candidatus Melainabacteria bacterium RIFCSPLOWO2_02_FULL_35_15]|nr:MAG: hypothetical protein A3F80_04730 [Candidatus Melainabacteria bacterium RIFCSPLOWO2_12_FULL_35_11]OGI13782.1 MAG: hypothetical protein A3I68_07465 [Candidatus Melainabacteria bacterium RIFCSPLOWO2_02_FULL_35_15]